MNARSEELLTEFRRVIGKACGNLKITWEKYPSDAETKAFMLEGMFEAAIAATLGGVMQYSDDEYAAACGEVAEKTGLSLPERELTRMVVKARANAEAAADAGLMSPRPFVFQNASRYLHRRLETVKSWSRRSAFVFGVDAIDDLIQGVQPGEMCVVAGAQASMKTSLALGGVENALARRMVVQFFSLDMEPGEIQERRVMRRLDCSQSALREMIKREDARVSDVSGEIDRIDDGIFELEGNESGQAWNIHRLVDAVRRRMPHVLVVDFLTLLRRSEQSDLDCVNEAMPLLKGLTQQLGLRTVLLSQMGRASKSEQLKGVTGGHAKGGGIVEELAHCEIELFNDCDPDGDAGRIVATVTKNRRGPSGRSFELERRMESMTFTGYSTRVQRAGKNANKPIFEPLQAPAKWLQASGYLEHSAREATS